MKYYNGIYFCSKPMGYSDEYYDCRHIISIEKLPEHYGQDQLMSLLRVGSQEWINCVKRIDTPSLNLGGFKEYAATLKDEVIEWLNENIAPSTDKRRADMPEGWMIYEPTKSIEKLEVSVFFLRRADAMAFKLRWM